MRVILGFGFPADYVVEQVSEFSTDEGVLRLGERGVRRSGEPSFGLWGEPGAPAMSLRFVPRTGEAWEAFVPCGSGKLSGIYTTPSPSHVCVIAGGDAYWVDVNDPDQSEAIRTRSLIVVDVIDAPVRNMVIFADFLELTAYGPSGRLWISERVSWDGIKLVKVEGDTLHGEAWAPWQERVPFTLDLSTRRVEGGTNPDKPQTNH